VHRGQVDAARHFAQYLRIAAIGLDTPRSNAKTAHKGCRHDPHFVLVAQREIGHSKCLGARLEHNPAVRLLLQEFLEAGRR